MLLTKGRLVAVPARAVSTTTRYVVHWPPFPRIDMLWSCHRKVARGKAGSGGNAVVLGSPLE